MFWKLIWFLFKTTIDGPRVRGVANPSKLDAEWPRPGRWIGLPVDWPGTEDPHVLEPTALIQPGAKKAMNSVGFSTSRNPLPPPHLPWDVPLFGYSSPPPEAPEFGFSKTRPDSPEGLQFYF